ncbi:lipocalin family protein [Salinimonas chungwhensis]|uniref:lipocalin family protein n=1 Tax=Salinimonas chungwhensis TaxID=265425 RepID=UPI00035D1522|nr:lipocalin family protein [Salinimonas chungwhensis]
MKQLIASVVACITLFGCTSKPDNVEPVSNFDASQYLGTWYEIARLDHSFEEGLSNVTATYSKREDGGIKVINRGYNDEEGKWDEAVGKAYFVEEDDIGWLKVSFFGPFYASYIVADLDKNYQWSLVTGPDKDYLWILARQPTMPKPTLEKLVEQAASLGYNTDALIYVEHGRNKS